jgi:hypothetical protein
MPLCACFRFASTLLIGALLALPCAAQDHPVEQTAFSAASIQQQITYLASDALRGRGSGEPGNEMAARFVAAEFARDGLKPLCTSHQRDPNAPMDGSGFFQPFTFIAGRAVGKDNLLEATFAGSAHSYRIHQEYEPSGVSGGGKAEGEVVFVGYGIRALQAQHNDYEGLDVKAKIVLLLAGSPNDDPHNALADYADIRRKALDARDMGATAVLVIVPQNSDAQGPSNFEFANASDVGLPVLRLRRPVAETWLHAAGKDLSALEKDADADKNVSVATGVQVRLAADVTRVQKVTANIVGLIEGSDPVLKNEYVVIGAHMDHLGMGGPGSLAKSSKPAIHHGADDNASGAAGVMQLAHYFGPGPSLSKPVSTPAPPRLKRSLILICFSGEELGLLGSEHYVKHPLVPLEKTVAMLNMDMVGRLRDNKLIVIGNGTSPEWDSLLDTVNRSAGFTLGRSESGFGASDQQSFYTQDIPVLFFFTGTHEDYHTPTDTADKINAPGEARVIQMVADCAARIADAPARPAFQRIQVADQSAPTRSFHVYFGSVPDYAAMVEGVQLNGVREGSPAEKAGLKAGDIILKFGDRTVKNIYDYTYALQDHRPGDVVPIVVRRGAETLTLTATLAAPPSRQE